MPFVIFFVLITSVVVAPTVNATESVRGDRNRIRAMVVEEARDMQLAVSLALAVAQAESDFDPLIESHKGARGVMQIMPATGRQPGFGVTPIGDPFDPVESKRFGKDYFGALLKRYGGNQTDALRAYNWGPGNLDKWIARGRREADPEMPAEVRDYPANVLAHMPAQPAPGVPSAVATVYPPTRSGLTTLRRKKP